MIAQPLLPPFRDKIEQNDPNNNFQQTPEARNLCTKPNNSSSVLELDLTTSFRRLIPPERITQKKENSSEPPKNNRKPPENTTNKTKTNKKLIKEELDNEEALTCEDSAKQKPFKCDDCGKSFSQLRNYKYHR